jgi:hypothetical protein
MMTNLPSALFIKHPIRIGDLIKPHTLHERKPFVVEKVISLSKIEYENFVTDLCVDRWFIEKYTNICRIDSDSVWHCILVKQKGGKDGVLVMSEGEVFPKWAAYINEVS